MSEKILSIIVPSYNMEKYLPKCLGSLVVEPHLMDRLEVLVVNDGSKDRTSEIAHEFAAKWSKTFKVIDKENGNYGSCINAALPIVSGEYVKVLDADDHVDTMVFAQWFQSFVSDIDGKTDIPDMVITDYRQVDPDGKIVSESPLALPVGRIFEADEMPNGRTQLIGIHSLCYRTSILRNMGYQQTEGCSYTDTEWFTLPVSRVVKVRYYPVCVTCYLIGRDGQTMDADTYIRRFGTVLELTMNMARRFDGLYGSADERSKRYFKERMLWLVVQAYSVCIFGYKGRFPTCDFISFDRELEKASMSLYLAADSIVASRRLRVRHIHEWRRNYSRNTPLLLLLKVYSRLARWIWSLR